MEAAPASPPLTVSVNPLARTRNYGGVLRVAIRDQAIELSETAASIWRRAEDDTSVEHIITGLAEEYDVAAELVRDDALEIIELLVEGGYLVARR